MLAEAEADDLGTEVGGCWEAWLDPHAVTANAAAIPTAIVGGAFGKGPALRQAY
jgi:hypothetical protein